MSPPLLHYLPPEPPTLSSDARLLLRDLPLADAEVLELGCGKAELAFELLESAPVRRYVGAEVDRQQLAKNLSRQVDPRLEFRLGGAECIEAADASFDVVLMMRSLHHVPPAQMAPALREVARVLRPGGHAWIAEPVYDGPLNALLSLFHDERDVRAEAFEAVRRSVDGGDLRLERQFFYAVERHFADFEAFDARILQATHTRHELSPELHARVRATFAEHCGPDGARFESPVRVEHLRRPSAA